MRPSRLDAGSAPIPFRTSFKHAAAERSTAENVLVRVEDSEGRIGLGEGCPRSYVTGETVAGALAFIQAHNEALSVLEDIDALRTWTKTHRALIDANPSAFCAIELALLDLFSRQAKCSVDALLNIAPSTRPLRTSAVYGAGGAAKFCAQYLAFGAAGMREAKLKIVGERVSDLWRAKLLAARGRLRLDANNLWPDARAAAAALQPLSAFVWAVEEPIMRRDWEGLRRLHRATDLSIILDESFLTLADMEQAPAGLPLIPNFRVSKLGGLLRAMDCLERWPSDIIVGAQVGETSILARAGLVLARAAGDRLQAFEGGYARTLLMRDVASPIVSFGLGGIVRCADAPGFGLAPNDLFDAAVLSHLHR